MKKLKVCFCSKTGEAVDEAIINAESYEDAFQQYIVGKEPNDFKSVIVDAAGFFESMSSTAQAFPNPLCRIQKSQINNDARIIKTASEEDLESSFSLTSNISKSHSEKLDRLIELQEKQLYWIRIIGIPFLFAAIGGFLAILFR